MTVVLDTNVVVAALVADGLCREVVHRAVRLRALVSSPALMDELGATLERKFTLTPSAAAFLDAFRTQVPLVEPVMPSTPVCRDRDDDVVLGTAVAARAEIIVSGDDDLPVLGHHEGVAIITPRQFLERLDQGVAVPAGRAAGRKLTRRRRTTAGRKRR